MAEKGHRVSLLDLSNRNIEVAREKSKERNIELEAYIHGNALELWEYEQKYDVILLMQSIETNLNESIMKKDFSECVQIKDKDSVGINISLLTRDTILEARRITELYEGYGQTFVNDVQILKAVLNSEDKDIPKYEFGKVSNFSNR